MKLLFLTLTGARALRNLRLTSYLSLLRIWEAPQALGVGVRAGTPPEETGVLAL